jgi:hypothetical protein
MARVRTADGRTGLGWLEWGHNVDPTRANPNSGRRAVRQAAAALKPYAAKLAARTPQTAIDALMESRVGAVLVAGLFRALPHRIDPRRGAIANATARFNVGDEASGRIHTYDLILRTDGAPRVIRRAANDPGPEPRMSLTVSASDLIALGSGRLDPMQAALERRLAVEGDFQFLAIVASLLAGDAFPPQKPLGPPLNARAGLPGER